MATEQSQRVDDALSSLVDAFLPAVPGEDEEVDDERRDNAFDLAKNVLERSGNDPLLLVEIRLNIHLQSRSVGGDVGYQSCGRVDQEEMYVAH